MNDHPGISIIIAVLNEEEYISECLHSLLEQTYPGKTEIIVVDGGSTDKTLEIVEEFQLSKQNIRILKNSKKIQAAGRNLGIRNSIYEFIAYIDGHSYADRNWLKRLYMTYAEIKKTNSKVIGIGSKYFNANNTKFTKASEALFRSFLAGAGKEHFLNMKNVSLTNNAYACLYDKHLLFECGLYDAELKIGEDIELNQRITKLGYDLYIDPQAITFYYRREKFSQLFTQQFKYGFWRWRVMRKLRYFSFNPFIPLIFVLALITMLILSFFGKPYIWVFANFLFYYLLIVFLFSALSASSKNANIFIVMYMTILLHISYGLGILAGFFRRN